MCFRWRVPICNCCQISVSTCHALNLLLSLILRVRGLSGSWRRFIAWNFETHFNRMDVILNSWVLLCTTYWTKLEKSHIWIYVTILWELFKDPFIPKNTFHKTGIIQCSFAIIKHKIWTVCKCKSRK